MKKILSTKPKGIFYLSHLGKTVILLLIMLFSLSTIKAQTIFSNPVGINVTSVGTGLDFHVSGGVRFNSLATGSGFEMVTTDALGNLTYMPIPSGTLPGTSVGQSMLWDGLLWQPNDFLKVPAFLGAPRIFEVGNGDPATLDRSINYRGNSSITLQGPFGGAGGVWTRTGWRATNNSNPLGDNFVGNYFHWQQFGSNVGLTDRISGGLERDLTLQFMDYTGGVIATNRLIFSSATGLFGSTTTTEHATILGNGNMGIGTPNPAAQLHTTGTVRFSSLSTTGAVEMVTTDALGNLNFQPIPTGTLPSGTSVGQSMLWDGALWQPNDFLKVPAFLGAPRIFEVGNGDPATLDRSINYRGNSGLALQGVIGLAGGVWTRTGWRATNNLNPAGDNFVGSHVNWQQFGSNVGLADRFGGGVERDLTLQFVDYTGGVTATNRLIFSSATGTFGSTTTTEHATILGNGNMGIGTPNPAAQLHTTGTVRFSSLSTTGAVEMVTTDALGNLNFQPIPTGTLPSGTSVGQSMLWDGLLWQPNDFLKVPAFLGAPRIFEVGNGDPAALDRSINYRGNSVLALQGPFGGPGGIWTRTGWRAVSNSNPLGDNFVGNYFHWQQFGSNVGLTDRIGGGVERDLTIQFLDYTGSPSANNRLIFSSAIGPFGSTTTTEHATILGNGNMGIGFANPNSRLTVMGAGAGPATSSLEVMDAGANSLFFVRDDGFVGIGTNNPTDKLTVNGNVVPNPGFGAAMYDLGINSPIDTWRDVYGVNAYTSTSDGRYKKNVADINYGLSQVMQLRPVSFEWKNGYNGTRLGFISQEVMEVVPEVVVAPKNEKEAYMMRYSELIPVLVSAIQEQQVQIENITPAATDKRIDELTTTNEELKARIKSLEDKLTGICNLPCVQEAIKQNSSEGTLNEQPQLFQNQPNPFGGSTTIKYYVPATATSAQIKIVDDGGKQLGEYKLKTGSGQLEITAGTISSGSYNYSLYVNDQLVDTKKMVIANY